MGIPITKITVISVSLALMLQTEALQRKPLRDDVHLLGPAMGLFRDWNSLYGSSDPVSIDKICIFTKPQQWLTEKGSLVQRELLLRHEDARFTTLVNACFAPTNESWTTTLPSPLNGTYMSPAVLRCALRYRTYHDVFSSSHLCMVCKQRVFDATGDQDSYCQEAGCLIRRQNLVHDKLFALAQEARLTPRLEVGHLLDLGSRKPADILLPSWDDGRDLCLDVSIASPFSGLSFIAGVGKTARNAEEQKIAKYEIECASNELLFRPFYSRQQEVLVSVLKKF